MGNNRGKNPNEMTKAILYSKSGGFCEFRGCGKYLFEDSLTLAQGNFANIAHNIASSPNGPRGNNRTSYMLSNAPENLLLLCPKHHKLVDSNPDIFDSGTLKKMKIDHEETIRFASSLLEAQESIPIIITSKIKGEQIAEINERQVFDAIMSSGYRVDRSNEKKMDFSPDIEYGTYEYWQKMKDKIDRFYYFLRDEIKEQHSTHLSFFGIAPIPLLIYFGYLIGDKIPTEVYQKFRSGDTWKWQSSVCTQEYATKKTELGSGDNIAVILSVSTKINMQQLPKQYDKVYELTALNAEIDSVQSKADLNLFWKRYQQILDEIANNHVNAHVDVFPAIPNSASFEIGRRFMKGVHCPINIYDRVGGKFVETICIGG